MNNEFDEEFFYKLTKAEAQLFLDNFLTEAKVGFNKLIESQSILDCSFDVGNIEAVFVYFGKKIENRPKEIDYDLPKYIRDTESYKENLYELTDESLLLILRLSYFLGESFVQTYPSLKWSIGEPKSVDVNKPVVTGFKSGLEMSVFDVTRNVMHDVKLERSITDFILTWENFVK